MKDMMGIELETGQHVFYFCPGPGGYIHEEAEIILIRENSIRVKFLGNITRRKKDQMSFGRTKGDQTNLYNTTGKVFVLCQHVEKERVALQDSIRKLVEENVKLRTGVEIVELQDKIRVLIEDGDKLQEELEKVHYRSDILDL